MSLGERPVLGTTKAEDVPSLFAVFDRMGLRLQSKRARVKVYVIEHVERPTLG